MEMLEVQLSTAFGQDSWDIRLPPTVTPPQIIRRLQKTQGIGLRTNSDDGGLIDYQILWKEQGRVLGVTETLDSAGVENGHHLIIQHEARAGGDWPPRRGVCRNG